MRDGMIGWRKLHNEELHKCTLHQKQNHQVIDEMGRACNTHEREECMYRVLVGKPEEKRLLGRHGHK
jgi:hypothetical protein